MWPWEHAAAGYVLYSVARRATGREPPGDAGTLALLAGTQVPDLVDKPLSWGLGLFPSGYAVGHSAVVALPLGALLVALGARTGRRAEAVAFVVGYWSHLVGDVLTPLRTGDGVLVRRVLWPLVATTPYEEDLGIGRGLVYLRAFADGLASTDPVTLVLSYLLVPAATVMLWVLDGAPGLRFVRRAVASIRR